MTETDICSLVENDTWMMAVLHEAEKLSLPEWMIGAGFLRNKVWDYLHGIQRVVADTSDIDLVYFDVKQISEEKDRILSERMSGTLGLRWEIKNQAYMHTRHNHDPYKNAAEGISHWVETPTCVAVTLRKGTPHIVAPHGVADLTNLVIRPVPSRTNDLEIFYKRISDKRWLEKWPKLKVVEN